ncbi:MAG: isopenicillin N synthase family oxygenase, partial [Actinobacteria bacterium]|nr:isopenicillin N synthase family oxygenase [Actinomycetota bacterium]
SQRFGPDGPPPRWGVAEHTDYGLLTLLAQDTTGGLEVAIRGRWIEVPPIDDALVCNLGDMLERLSGGRFVATAHRVTVPRADRISMPLFLDPGWDVVVESLPGCDRGSGDGAAEQRWDGEDVHDVTGPYSEYLLRRVARVFPDLYGRVAPDHLRRSELDG